MKNKKVLIIGGISLVLIVTLFGLGLYAYSAGYYHAMRGGIVESQDRDQAIAFYKEAYARNPNAYMVAHDIACCYSVKNEKKDAIKWLKLTLKTSYADFAREWASSEKDFNNIKDDPEFQLFLKGTLSAE
jgi:tetratricopeptide (TPR) repeat protein